MESLSSYARQFLGKLNKPKVEYIKGIAPAIAIEQKVNSTNPRSTVGTSTEIYDYLKLLYARIGKTYSPISNKEVKKDTVTDVITHVKGFAANTKLLLLAPVHIDNGRKIDTVLKILEQQGYSRVKVNNKVLRINEVDLSGEHDFYLVIDRIIVSECGDVAILPVECFRIINLVIT